MICGYSGKSETNTRLEKSVYGKTSTGDINKRIKRLSADILNLAIHVPFIFIGINNIMTGAIFRKLEAE